MENKKKSFRMPHTYIIIFGVILFAALLTVFIPLGKYETKEITYMQNGTEKTKTVLDPDSFQYVLDEMLREIRHQLAQSQQLRPEQAAESED